MNRSQREIQRSSAKYQEQLNEFVKSFVDEIGNQSESELNELFEYYDKRWRSTCRFVNNSDKPFRLLEDAFANKISDLKKLAFREAQELERLDESKKLNIDFPWIFLQSWLLPGIAAILLTALIFLL